MAWTVVLPLLLLALLVYVFIEFARRARVALALAREAAGFRAAASGLGHTIDELLGHLAQRTDAVRHGTLPPGELTDELQAAVQTLDQAADTARGFAAPSAAEPLRDELAEDIARGSRAVEMILHGCQLAADGRGRQTELEAQTNVKRGYLNLLHAREALAGHVADAARTQPDRPQVRRASGV
ncbi:MAG TPA: hypothetical protein VFW92_08730 [Candidatus Limnocylindrales bacterium]|nr:hypothetical protein [Candidatus Limnocylindrales bacterium]